MPIDQIKTSEAFRKSTLRASLAIVQFVIIYFLLICGALLLTALCMLGAYSLVSIKFTAITVLLGIALLATAFFVLYFLVKFIFKKNIVDRSGLTEVFEKDQPELFALIREIVMTVQTDFPKKVYLSPEVNASVFYDSGFWSMFLPVRKNLQIGMGLVNTVTVSEFKGILAHEFGHFSQRSMKVGSYVYNVNYVIHNMLFDNASFDAMLEKWGDGNGYLKLGSTLAKLVIKGIQWVLGKAYTIVNLNYLSLSREMEFHADEVAAHVAGSLPLANALKRFELADYAFEAVSNFYYRQESHSPNFYRQLTFALHFLGKQSKLPFQNGLPVTNTAANRYNKSKLVIKDQWASHPSVEDRVERLLTLNRNTENEDTRLANQLFHGIETIQQKFTQQLFNTPEAQQDVAEQTDEEFQNAFLQDYQTGSFNEIYNGYYNSKNPAFPEGFPAQLPNSDPAELFGDEAVDQVYVKIAIESDIQTVEAINEGHLKIKSFDYDGNKYTADEAAFLLPNLRAELEIANKKVDENDSKIYRFFVETARRQQKSDALETCVRNFQYIEKSSVELYLLYQEMAERMEFLTTDMPIEQVENKLSILSEKETGFKNRLNELKTDPLYLPEITSEILDDFNNYLQNTDAYFANGAYNQETLKLLFSAINQYNLLANRAFFYHKKQLLDFQAELFHLHQPANMAS